MFHFSLSHTQERCSKTPNMHLHHFLRRVSIRAVCSNARLHISEGRMTAHIEEKSDSIERSNASKHSPGLCWVHT